MMFWIGRYARKLGVTYPEKWAKQKRLSFGSRFCRSYDHSNILLRNCLNCGVEGF